MCISPLHHSDRTPKHYNRQLTPHFPPQDGLGWTPLMMASSLKAGDGDALIDTLLSAGADVNAKNNNGQTALHFAASKNNIDTARKLTAHKASARAKDKRGQLALHRAAAVGSVPMMKLLLENKSPVNATDVDGMTALHHGEFGLAWDILRMWGEESVDLWAAISEGHGDAALMLLKAGAETDKRDTDGHLAIQLAPDTKVGRSSVYEGIVVGLTAGRSETLSSRALSEKV